MTMADLRRTSRRRCSRPRCSAARSNDKISVTEEEAKAYYAEHQQEFTTPSEVTLREILIEVPTTDEGVNVAQDDEVKAEAEALRARLLAGEPFPRLAADFPTPPRRANGGLIGPIRQDELAPAFQKRLEPMKVGDVTEPIRTTRGYQMLKLESRTETRGCGLRRCAERHRQPGGGNEESRASCMKYLDRLRSQATITWRNDELKRAYEQALAERRKVTRRDDRRLVRAVDAVAARAGGARAAGAEAHRVVSADRHAVEPLEGPEEEDRLAALSRILLRALRPARSAWRC